MQKVLGEILPGHPLDPTYRFVREEKLEIIINQDPNQCFLARQRETNEVFIATALKNQYHPDCTIKEYYQTVTSLNGQDLLNADFAEFLISKTIQKLEESGCKDPLQLQLQIFGKQANAQEKQFFIQIYEFYRQSKTNNIQKKQKVKQIHQKFKPFPRRQEIKAQNHKKFQYFQKNQLGSKIKIMPAKRKREIIETINANMKKSGSEILKYKNWDNKQYFIVLQKFQNGPIYSLKSLLQTKITSEFQLPKPTQLLKELIISLKTFKQQYGKNYSTLSFQNINFNLQTRKVQFNIVPFILSELGIRDKLMNIDGRFEMLQRKQRKFYYSLKQIQNKERFALSDETVTWQSLVLVDCYENRGYSYFKWPQTKKSFISSIKSIVKIIKEKHECKVFGREFASFIKYYRLMCLNDKRQYFFEVNFEIVQNYLDAKK